ncbi:cardio acceleratory peptide 2b [Anopheles bellator]|uniref:cardio acceleratory peptide 2b n=1 Tax=Anopheles bellator TaxID=139047 RepID=UPI00264815A7|nr:cardio acceleratory peptide 2b [Anopheles bellator]
MPAFVSVALVLLAVHFCRAEVEFDGSVRSKRGPTVGLFAFPRVGRSDPDVGFDWDTSGPVDVSGDDYDDYPLKEIKRQGLVPFPRVGRAGKQDPPSSYWQVARSLQQQQQQHHHQQLLKRAGGSGANSGMWFGPRLGKRADPIQQQKGDQI